MKPSLSNWLVYGLLALSVITYFIYSAYTAEDTRWTSYLPGISLMSMALATYIILRHCREEFEQLILKHETVTK